MSETNHPWCSSPSRDEAIRAAEDAAAAERTPLPDHRDLPAAVADLRRRVEGLEAVADAWRRQCEADADAENREAAPGSRDGVTAAPAANAGGEANYPAAPDSSQEPVAWGVLVGGKIDRHAGSDALFIAKDEADDWCGAASLRGRGTVVPLFASPQPPRGWLTKEEREAVEKCLRHFVRQEIDFLERNDPGHRWLEVWRRAEARLTALLARSTPPRVKVPVIVTGFTHREHAEGWVKAIRAAGVEVGE